MMDSSCGSLATPVALASAAFVRPHPATVRTQGLPKTQQQTLRALCWSSVFKSGIPTTDDRQVSEKSRRGIGFVRGAAILDQGSTTAPPAPPTSAPAKQTTDVRVVKIADDVVTLRGLCGDRLKLEIEYGMKRGTTDNSYLIKGGNGFALIDVPDQAFSEAFTKVLSDVVDLKNLKYLILGHFSPKRVESLQTLLRCVADGASPPIEIYCSNPAAQLLKKSFSESLEAKAFSVKSVRTGDVLDLGGGRELRFFLTPTPRWPDGMCTYDPASQLLFSNKLFSAHVNENDFDVGGWEALGEDWRYYYDCMLAPMPTQAKAALDKLQVVGQFSKPSYKGKTGIDVIKADMEYIFSTVMAALNLPISKSQVMINRGTEGGVVTSAICPIHGPIVRSTLTELVREYGLWTDDKLKQASESTVAVIYASAYGMTAALAQAISRGISKAGVGVETINVEISSTEEVIAALQRSCGFVIGSPTLAGHLPTPIQNALGLILNDDNAKAKPCGVFGSFGWSGEAVDILETRLKDCGFSLAFPSIRCKFQPTEATLQTCEESGTDLAQAVKKVKFKKRSQSSPQFTVASNVEQAVGRVVGSLCILSAKSGDAESAMLASWVSQASFVPPGLTVAVAKDRAVEGLVLPGGRFVLNVLGQNKSAPIVKQLLKPFEPGEQRYEGLDVEPASSGGFILKAAISWMECTVQSRMDVGDHWLLYATVDAGALQDDKTLTAMHYRKTGARY